MSDPTGTSKLKWRIFVPPAVATVNDDLPPGETARMWSPTSSILIHGERDAILVDIAVTNAQATALADWVEETGKILTPSTRRMVVEVSPSQGRCYAQDD